MTVRIFCLLALLAAGTAGADPVTIAGGTTNDTESRIIRLSDGRLMAAIGRNPYGSWSATDIYVSFSADDGATWSAPALAVGGTADQATIGLLQLPGDTIRLWYGSNESGTYRIHTAYSVDGASWMAEGQVPLGWADSLWCYDPTVITTTDSTIVMIYRMGKSATNGAGAYVASKPKGGSWDTARRLVNARAYRPRIMRHTDGTYLAAFQRQSGGSTTQIDVFVRQSANLTAWTDSVRLTANQNSHDAWCLQVPDSGYVVYYAKFQNAPYDAYNLCRRRSADGLSWQAEQQLTFDGDSLHNTQPSLFVHAGGLYRSWTRANDYDNDNDILFERFPLGTTGVAAVEFAAHWNGLAVDLRWRSATEQDCYHWIVERGDNGGGYREIMRLPAAASRSDGATYTHADRAAPRGATCSYRLGRIALDGSAEWSEPVMVRTGGAVSPACRAAPNPAGARGTVFRLTLDRPQHADLSIYNAAGQRVATICSGPAGPGDRAIRWEARDRSGTRLASGVYTWRLVTEGGASSGRLTVVR